MSPLHTDIPATPRLTIDLDRAGLIDRLIELLVEGKGENRRSTRVVAELTGLFGEPANPAAWAPQANNSVSMSDGIVVGSDPWLSVKENRTSTRACRL